MQNVGVYAVLKHLVCTIFRIFLCNVVIKTAADAKLFPSSQNKHMMADFMDVLKIDKIRAADFVERKCF